MLVGVIPGYVLPVNEAFIGTVDALELRLDYSAELDFTALANVCQSTPLPLILTLRSALHGGVYPHSETHRWQQLEQLATLRPAYMDVEYDLPSALLARIHALYPSICLIGSYHNHTDTPTDLAAVFKRMQAPYFSAYKLVTFAQNTLDALRVLQHLSLWSRTHIISAFCMGEFGQFTRVIAPLVGSAMTYAALDENNPTAPGQLSVHELTTVYRVPRLTRQTRIYALLGDPVEQSVGHRWHNQAMPMRHLPGVYIKMRVRPQELAQVMVLCNALPFEGFSITMPLKQIILDYIPPGSREVAAIGAANTLLKRNGQWVAYNTDGEGALAVFTDRGVPLKGKTVVILGAGGAARAIAFQAALEQAHVIVLNRRLVPWAESYAFDAMPSFNQYAIAAIINTLPEHAYLNSALMAQLQLHPELFMAWAMDCVYQPRYTRFLKLAQQFPTCQLIFGLEMFENQAKRQLQHWMH